MKIYDVRNLLLKSDMSDTVGWSVRTQSVVVYTRNVNA